MLPSWVVGLPLPCSFLLNYGFYVDSHKRSSLALAFRLPLLGHLDLGQERRGNPQGKHGAAKAIEPCEFKLESSSSLPPIMATVVKQKRLLIMQFDSPKKLETLQEGIL